MSYVFAFLYCSWGSQGKNTEVVCIPFSGGPHSVRPLHHARLSWVALRACLSFIELDKAVVLVRQGNAKECSNYRTIAFISHASKVMLKILQARIQQYANCELPDVQAGFRKGRGTRDQIANIRWIIEKAREFQKNIYFCFIDYAKAF